MSVTNRPTAAHRSGPVTAREAKAHAKAAKAYAKATRPFYRKKRFLVPFAVAVLVLLIILTGSGGDPTGTTAQAPAADEATPILVGTDPAVRSPRRRAGVMLART